MPIASAQNPKLKEIRRALAHGELTEDGYLVLETIHLLEEAVRSGCEIRTVYATREALARIPASLHVTEVEGRAMRQAASTESSQGILALVKPREWSSADITGGIAVVLDGIQDPGNAGAIVRAAEAFGAIGVILLKGCAGVHNSKFVRATAGSLFRIPVVPANQPPDLPLYAAVPEAPLPVEGVDFTKPCAIVVGSEAHGVSPALRQRATAFSIPTQGVESLNAAMAASIILYEASRQRRTKQA